jgi:metal-sulfur cluster biosynthetic enzyme
MKSVGKWGAMPDVTTEEVTLALKEVYDPEIPVNVVDLGLIYSINVDDNNHVHVDMTLTAAGCGMGPFIAQQAEWAIADIDGVKDVDVEISFEPPWSPDLITEDGRKLLGLDD